MKKVEILNKLGFAKNATSEVIAGLKAKETKTNLEIVSRIKESDIYKVFTDGTRFTVTSTYKVTTAEIKQLEKILKAKYVKAADLMDENGLWTNWTRAEW